MDPTSNAVSREQTVTRLYGSTKVFPGTPCGNQPSVQAAKCCPVYMLSVQAVPLGTPLNGLCGAFVLFVADSKMKQPPDFFTSHRRFSAKKCRIGKAAIAVGAGMGRQLHKAMTLL